MMTDFRALCAELTAWAEKTSAHYFQPPDVLLRARAALADGPAVPQGREPAAVTGRPSDEELDAIERQCYVETEVLYSSGCEYVFEHRRFARAVLARWGNPMPSPPADGKALPEGYIDPEHSGDDRALLETFYSACQAEGGTADKVTLRGLRAVLASRANDHCDGVRQSVREAIAEAIGDGAYDCFRVWEAWGVGTMGEDDFASIVGSDERIAEIADAAIDAMRRAAPAPPADGELAGLVADLQQQANHGFSDLTRNLLISLASHMAYMQGQLQARHDPDEDDLEDCYWYAESVALRQMVSDALAGEPAAVIGQPRPMDEDWDALVNRLWSKYETIGYQGERFMYEGDFCTALDLVRQEIAHWGNPAPPPADGEVAELVAWLREQLHVCLQAPWTPGIKHFGRAAELLQRQVPVPVAVSDALIKAECALSDIAEGEPMADEGDPLKWAERRCADTLAIIRPTMMQHKIRTSEWPPVVATAKPLPEVDQMTWQPIDTAPRDGTEILASDYDAIEIVSWVGPRLDVRITGEWTNREGEAMYPAWWQPLPDHLPLPEVGE